MEKLTVLLKKKYLLLVSIIFIIALLFIIQFNNRSVSKDTNAFQNTVLAPVNEKNKQSAYRSGTSENKTLSDSEEEILKLKMFKFSSVDGDIKADENGQLIIDRSLRHWIDFYLSAIGELSLAEIQQLMNQKIALLPMPSRQQAQKLLADYLAYKEALASYEDQFQQSGPTDHLENLQQRHDWQKRLRRQNLSQEAVNAFWQLDELVDDYALEQLVINNSDASEEEKMEQLSKLDNALPEELRDFRSNLYIASNLQEQVAQSRQQGDSDEAVRQLRIKEVGLEATDRLEALEAKQNVWQQRIVEYSNEVEAVAAIEGLTEQDKKEKIRVYQENNFSINEQRRLDTALSLLNDE